MSAAVVGRAKLVQLLLWGREFPRLQLLLAGSPAIQRKRYRTIGQRGTVLLATGCCALDQDNRFPDATPRSVKLTR